MKSSDENALSKARRILNSRQQTIDRLHIQHGVLLKTLDKVNADILKANVAEFEALRIVGNCLQKLGRESDNVITVEDVVDIEVYSNKYWYTD